MADLATDAGLRRVIRIGHRGAAALAAPNTVAAIAAAVVVGVDWVEVDVRTGAGGRLVLAHDRAGDAAEPFAAALATVAATPGLGLNVDLKVRDAAGPAAEAVARAGLLERTLFSGHDLDALRDVADATGGAGRTGWSFPRSRLHYLAARARPGPLETRLVATVRAAGAGALMANHRLVTAALVAALHAEGLRCFAWTVNDASRIAALAALGVDGVASDDPRRFAAHPEP